MRKTEKRITLLVLDFAEKTVDTPGMVDSLKSVECLLPIALGGRDYMLVSGGLYVSIRGIIC